MSAVVHSLQLSAELTRPGKHNTKLFPFPRRTITLVWFLWICWWTGTGYLSFFLSIYLSICLSIFLSVFFFSVDMLMDRYWLSIFFLSIFLSSYFSIFLYIYLSIYLSICLSFFLSTGCLDQIHLIFDVALLPEESLSRFFFPVFSSF